MDEPHAPNEEPLNLSGGATVTAVREDPTAPELPPDAAPGGGGGWGMWGAPTAWVPPPPPPSRPHPLRVLALALSALAIVAASATVGFALGSHGNPMGSTTSATSPPGTNGNSSASSGSGLNASQISSAVDPGLVDVNSTLGYQGGGAAGTGIVLTSNGEVVTNNHVVEGATSVSVTDIGNGKTYSATVVGTDATDDIAVLKLNGASGLTTASIGNSSNVKVGDSVVAIGNAGGTGGTPSVSTGAVTALNQAITAGDQLSSSTEQLSGLIETNATLQPGDSGGPLVNASGKVVGIDTAASSNFQFQSGSSQNFAIPINTALSIARQIEAGNASSTIHIGQAAFLGVEVESAASVGNSTSGAAVVGVEQGSPAQQAGLAAGDVINSLNGQNVDSPNTLSSIMEGLHPGNSVQLGWVDSAGQQHTAQVQLATGPAA